MGLKNEQFEKGELKKYLGKPKAGEHKWLKKMMNRFIRRKGKEIDEDAPLKLKKTYKGWEL